MDGERSARRAGVLQVLAAGVLWGTTGTAQALAPQPVDPRAVGVVRLTLGALALLLLAALDRRGTAREGATPRPAAPWPWSLTLLAAAGVAAYQPLFFAAVQRTGVAAGTLVAIGSAPVLAGLLAYLLQREPPGPRWAVATFLALAGCTLLARAQGPWAADAGGLLLAVLAGAGYATYTVASRRLVVDHEPARAAAVVFALAALLLAPLWALADLGWLLQPRGLAVALHLGLVTTAGAYALFTRGLRRVPASVAATLTLVEPLTATLLGVTVLGERLPPAGWAGAALLAVGVAWLSLARTSPPAAAAAAAPATRAS